MSSVFAQYGAAIRCLNHTLRHPRHQAFALAVVVVVVTGVVFYSLAEGWSIADSFYFTIVALSTIGFGDFAPTTTGTRLFTVFYAIVGVGLIGTLLHLVVTRAKAGSQNQDSAAGRRET